MYGFTTTLTGLSFDEAIRPGERHLRSVASVLFSFPD